MESIKSLRRIFILGCFILLGINVAYMITGVARYGSQHIDAYGIWLFKAKAIQQTQGIPWRVLKDPHYAYSHQTYPLLLPFILSTGSRMLWLYPVGYVVILGLLYQVLRGEGCNHIAALGWTTVASFMGPLVAQGGRGHVGLADIWITLLVAVCMRFVQKRQWWGIVGAVMVASMIKTEGIFLLAFLLLQKRTSSWILRYLVAVIPFFIWQVMVRVWGIPSDVTFGWPGFGLLVNRAGVVAIGVVKEMANWRNWYVVWGIFIFSPIRKSRSSDPASGVRLRSLFTGISEKYCWNIVLGVMALGYVAVYLFSNLDTGAYVSSSVDRIMLQLLPLWWVVMIESFS